MYFKVLIALVISTLVVTSCSEDNITSIESNKLSNSIRAVDISSFPEINEYGTVYLNEQNEESDLLNILKNSNINTIRLRVWVDPINKYSSLNEVTKFSEHLRKMGFKIWIALHYSDSWADPGQQVTPAKWQDIPFVQLKDSIYNYTKSVIKDISPEIIQIGNEINNGLLHPEGYIWDNYSNFIQLLTIASQAVRDENQNIKIMIHYAGMEGSESFYQSINELDYDLIGISFYPIWHGKDLSELKNTLAQLKTEFGKEVVIAETSYPFTLEWNDWTSNIVGSNDQLILPDYPATPMGQKKFISDLFSIVNSIHGVEGLCYWGGELVAWKGIEAEDASPWENQALFDFTNKALPILEAFEEN